MDDSSLFLFYAVSDTKILYLTLRGGFPKFLCEGGMGVFVPLCFAKGIKNKERFARADFTPPPLNDALDARPPV